jgi:hypothetical protein
VLSPTTLRRCETTLKSGSVRAFREGRSVWLTDHFYPAAFAAWVAEMAVFAAAGARDISTKLLNKRRFSSWHGVCK